MTKEIQPEPVVRIVQQETGWTLVGSVEIDEIRSAIHPVGAFIEQVGSTAVPGLDGKPVVDILLTLKDWKDEETVSGCLIGIGYEQEAVSGNEQRRFFQKPSICPTLDAFHLHVTPPDSAYGRNMTTFRDLLIGDPKIGLEYVALKKQLAHDHPDHFDAYTNGKGTFVAKVLSRGADAFGIDQLLTRQRAELNEAQKYQNFELISQFGVAVVTALSVFTDDNVGQLTFAVIGFLLAFVWFVLASRRRKHRSVGDRARRVVLLWSGLDEEISAQQRRRIFDGFTVSIDGNSTVREASYFASRTPPGFKRLAELIEESAFWTRDLQRRSGELLLAALAIVSGAMIFILGVGIPILETGGLTSMARVLVAVLVFLLTSNLIGTILAHFEAANSIGEILHRIEAAEARGHPAADVLLLMSDYNATVESAPFALPGVFELRRAFLTKRWRNHLQNKTN